MKNLNKKLVLFEFRKRSLLIVCILMLSGITAVNAQNTPVRENFKKKDLHPSHSIDSLMSKKSDITIQNRIKSKKGVETMGQNDSIIHSEHSELNLNKADNTHTSHTAHEVSKTTTKSGIGAKKAKPTAGSKEVSKDNQKSKAQLNTNEEEH